MHVRKMEVFILSPLVSFSVAAKKNQSVWAKVSGYEKHFRQMRKLEEFLAYSWFTEV